MPCGREQAGAHGGGGDLVHVVQADAFGQMLREFSLRWGSDGWGRSHRTTCRIGESWTEKRGRVACASEERCACAAWLLRPPWQRGNAACVSGRNVCAQMWNVGNAAHHFGLVERRGLDLLVTEGAVLVHLLQMCRRVREPMVRGDGQGRWPRAPPRTLSPVAPRTRARCESRPTRTR